MKANMFIKVTKIEDNKSSEITLNAVFIRDITPLADGTCMIDVTNGRLFLVKDTFEELNEKLGVK